MTYSTLMNYTATLAAALTLTACTGQNSLLNKSGASATPPALSTPAPPPLGAEASPDLPPYVLTAQSSGQFIDFSIYNMGSSDLKVEKDSFAIINADSREVVPYNKENAIIDIPPAAVVKPNETLTGRAIFNSVNSPAGRRLVFKPDAVGTFANINPAHKTR